MNVNPHLIRVQVKAMYSYIGKARVGNWSVFEQTITENLRYNN